MPHRLTFDRFKAPLAVGAVLVTRASIFGNPWVVGSTEGFAWPKGTKSGWRGRHAVAAGILSRENAVGQFREWIERGHLRLDLLPDVKPDAYGALRTDLQDRRELIARGLPILRGHDLACSCPQGVRCHADVLLELANQENEDG